MTMNNEIVQQLGKLTVMDEDGEAVLLSSLWKDKLSALVFVRHFG